MKNSLRHACLIFWSGSRICLLLAIDLDSHTKRNILVAEEFSRSSIWWAYSDFQAVHYYRILNIDGLSELGLSTDLRVLVDFKSLGRLVAKFCPISPQTDFVVRSYDKTKQESQRLKMNDSYFNASVFRSLPSCFCVDQVWTRAMLPSCLGGNIRYRGALCPRNGR